MPPDRSSIVPGYRVPPFVRTAGFHSWNRYAAVNSEFVDIHMDDTAGRSAGYPGAIGMGNLTLAWVHAMLRQWLAGQGRILGVSGQFRSPALNGDKVTCCATVTAVHPDEVGLRVELDLEVRNQRGEDLMPGTAAVLIPPDTLG